MQPIPLPLQKQFEKHLKNRKVSGKSKGSYKKWLQYYLDFCRKYNFPPIQKESLLRFVQKLQEKRQTKTQQDQALEAITLYYQIVKERELPGVDKTSHFETLKKHKSFKNSKLLNSRVADPEPVHYKKALPRFHHEPVSSSNTWKSDLSNKTSDSSLLQNKQEG